VIMGFRLSVNCKPHRQHFTDSGLHLASHFGQVGNESRSCIMDVVFGLTVKCAANENGFRSLSAAFRSLMLSS
jgi:hypothetical protein